MIRNIIFDMGRVLIHWDPEYMLNAMDITEADRAAIRKELFQNIEWIRMDRGVLTEDEVTTIVCNRLPEKLHDVVFQLVHFWHRDFLRPIEGMGDLVNELKKNGYHIYLLSNAGCALRGYFSRIPGSESFDGLMVSAEEKLLKPEHEIYERLFERFSLQPEECWFIDDNAANIEGALTVGMGGTIFCGDVKYLREQLCGKGIRCSL